MPKHRGNGEGMVRKRADGRWEARYTDTRESDPQKRVKQIIKKTQKEAIAQLKIALSEIANNQPLLSKENPTISDWFHLWMTEYKINDLRESTYETYLLNIREHIDPIIGQIKIKDVKGIQIQNLYNMLQRDKNLGGHGLASASVLKIRNILSGAFKQAMANYIIKANPMDGTKPPKLEDNSIRILTLEEQKRFSAVLPFFNTGNMFALSLATGMRIGEICALETSDIDRTEKFIRINKSASRYKDKHTGEISLKSGPPKTKYSIRKIPLLPSVEVILDRQKTLADDLRKKALEQGSWTDNSLVFPTDEGNIHDKSGMRSSMQRILKRADLPHITIHALRHTYATTALNSGVSAHNVAKCLGHKDGATTLRFYAHYINTETITQLGNLEEKNINHLGITKTELERITKSSEEVVDNNLQNRLNAVVNKAKNFPYKKSVELMLSFCNEVLCEPIENLSASDKDLLLHTMAHYNFLKSTCLKREDSKNITHDEDDDMGLYMT